MSRHLKTLISPKTMGIPKKVTRFTAAPRPGAWAKDKSITVAHIIRDALGLADDMREVKLILNRSAVSVNGKVVKEKRMACGLFDIVHINYEHPQTKKKIDAKYRIVLDSYGRYELVTTKTAEGLLYVRNKYVGKQSKKFLSSMNGFNIKVSDNEFQKIKVHDVVVYDYDKKKIKKVIPFGKGARVFVTDGDFVGKIGEVVSVEKYNGQGVDVVTLTVDGTQVRTAAAYVYVVGDMI